MRISKNNLLYKVFGVIRFLFLRIFYFRSLSASGLSLIGKGCYFFLLNNGKLDLGKKIIVSDFVEIQSQGKLKIGNHCTINRYSRIIAFKEILIGNFVTIAQFVTILDHDHKYYKNEQGDLLLDGYTCNPVKIGNNVWLSDKCTILKGVTIGDNVIAGAHTLINKDVPPNCIIGGIPFKILKYID